MHYCIPTYIINETDSQYQLRNVSCCTCLLQLILIITEIGRVGAAGRVATIPGKAETACPAWVLPPLVPRIHCRGSAANLEETLRKSGRCRDRPPNLKEMLSEASWLKNI